MAAASPSNAGSSPDQAPASKPNSSARDSMMLSTSLMAGFVALLTALDWGGPRLCRHVAVGISLWPVWSAPDL